MEIILAILVAISWIILLSVTITKPINPLIKLQQELKEQNIPIEDIYQISKEYTETFSYKCYELKNAYYELGQTIKNSLKK